jgi:hypothetical protein
MKHLLRRLTLLIPLTALACTSNAAPGGTSSPIVSDGATTASDASLVTAEDGGSFVAIPLTACNPNVYSAAMTVGGSQTFQLLLDTGSTTLAVAAVGCSSCTDAGVSDLYQPSPTAIDLMMPANAGFGDGEPQNASGWAGEIYQDWVGAGSTPDMTQVKLVAIEQQDQFLVGTCGGGPPQGVLGFAPSSIEVQGTNGFFDQLVADGGVNDLFATRLCSTEGTLWLGGFDPSLTTAPPVYTPMLDVQVNGALVQAWYTVNLASISIVGTTIPVATASFPGAMLDTGSSYSTLPPAAFSTLTSTIAANSAFSGVFGANAASFFSSVNTCVRLSQTKAALDAALPGLTLTLGSNPSISVQATATESYLLSRGGLWCPAITALTPDANSFPNIAAHLGAPMLASNVVIFDRANQRVGFAPHRPCTD